MWRQVKQVLNSLVTYPVLSPDVSLRRRVNRRLRERPFLNSDEWFESFWKIKDISKPTVDFVYHNLSRYSGIEFARVLPGDRLEEDLHWTEVCWFDWEFSLCDDIEREFGFDISDRFDVKRLLTVADLVTFLDGHIRQKAYLSS